ASALVSWKVRTMPARATWKGGRPVSDVPSSDHVPLSARSKPVRRLNSVVLPAPFGPIIEVMSPRWTSRCSTSTARRPPKERETPSTRRIGSGLATPGRASTPASGWRGSSTCTDHHLLALAEDSLRAPDHQGPQHDAHDDEAHRGDLLAREE